MAEAIEELKRTSGSSPALEAYAQYVEKLKNQGSPDKGPVVVDAVAVKSNGERTSLGVLKQRVAALKVEVAKLNERASTSTASGARCDSEAQQLEREATRATGENVTQKMESSRAQIESQAENERATSLERSAQESEAAAKNARREADLLRAQGEREVARSQAEGNNEAYQRGMRLLSSAGEREAVVLAKSTEASGHSNAARSRRQNAADAGARHQRADSAATEADRRATSLKDQSRARQLEGNRHKADAVSSQQASNDRSLELELLEKKVDELVEMAKEIEFIVAS